MTPNVLLIPFLLFLLATIETEIETGTEIFCPDVLLARPPGTSANQGIMTTATATGRETETETETETGTEIVIVIGETRTLPLFHLLCPLQVGTGTTHAIATATTERRLRLRLSQPQLLLRHLLLLTCPLIRDITSRATLLRVLVDMTLMRPLTTAPAAAL
jgi:hypothetical protein